MLPPEMKKLKQLEDENARLKKIVADLTQPILRRCVLPLQTIADHIDDTTDDALVIDARYP
jgi:hypothetical protein